MTSYNLLLLPGDGIGTEIMAEVKTVIDWFGKRGVASFEYEQDLVGGSAYDAHGKAVSEATMAKALAADAVMFGAVGGPKWADVPYDVRPEAALLRLRKDLALFANLRPAICYPALAEASVAQARAGRGSRHPDRARAHRRRLFRRAEGDRDAGERAEARRRHPALHDAPRSSASPASPSTWRAPARAERSIRPRSTTS